MKQQQQMKGGTWIRTWNLAIHATYGLTEMIIRPEMKKIFQEHLD